VIKRSNGVLSPRLLRPRRRLSRRSAHDLIAADRPQSDEHGTLFPNQLGDQQPEPGADGCGCLPQRLLLRPAVQGGHRAAARTSTFSPAASSGRSSSNNETVTASWRSWPPAPASRTRASSPATSSASSASRRGSSGRAQESPKRGKSRQETGRAAPLPFLMRRVSRRGRPEGECGWTSSRAF